jgi:ABC-type transport system involved in multi-copper enzyme maturation permease subunit
MIGGFLGRSRGCACRRRRAVVARPRPFVPPAAAALLPVRGQVGKGGFGAEPGPGKGGARPVLTIVWLTWKEAVRRRAPVVTLLVAALLLVGAFVPLTGRLLLVPRPEANRIYASVYIALTTDIIKFFVSVLGLTMAAGAISAELERGVLSSILPKPITRLSVYAGKWLGIFLFVAANLLLWVTIIWGVASYRAPAVSHMSVWRALPYLMLYPAMFTTLALLFSTFAAFPLAAGLSILLTGVGWAEGFLYLLSRLFAIDLLLRLSAIAGYILPIGRMSRWVAKGIGPLTFFGGQTAEIGSRGPFGEIKVAALDLPYIGAYIAAAFVLGAILLGRRDV